MRKMIVVLGVLLAAVWFVPIPALGGDGQASRPCIADIVAGIELAKRPDYDYNRHEIPFRRSLEDKQACVKYEGDGLPGDRQPPRDDQIEGPMPEHLRK